MASNHGLLEQEALYLRDLGQVYTQVGRYAEAETALRRSLEILGTLRRAGFSDAANIDRLESLQRALVAQGKPGEALEVAEATRARAFADLLSRANLRPDDPSARVTPDLETFRAMARDQRATIMLYTTENIDPNAESVHAYLQYYLQIWADRPPGQGHLQPVADQRRKPGRPDRHHLPGDRAVLRRSPRRDPDFSPLRPHRAAGRAGPAAPRRAPPPSRGL